MEDGRQRYEVTPSCGLIKKSADPYGPKLLKVPWRVNFSSNSKKRGKIRFYKVTNLLNIKLRRQSVSLSTDVETLQMG